jgi:hypothetical protein
LAQHVASGGFGLILPYQTIASSLTVEQAIDAALRRLHPHLIQSAGLDALTLCSADRPFLAVVEDINKSAALTFSLAIHAREARETNPLEPADFFLAISVRSERCCAGWPPSTFLSWLGEERSGFRLAARYGRRRRARAASYGVKVRNSPIATALRLTPKRPLVAWRREVLRSSSILRRSRACTCARWRVGSGVLRWFFWTPGMGDS